MDDQAQAPTYTATIAILRQHYVIPGLQLAVMHHKNRRPLNLKNESSSIHIQEKRRCYVRDI